MATDILLPIGCEPGSPTCGRCDLLAESHVFCRGFQRELGFDVIKSQAIRCCECKAAEQVAQKGGQVAMATRKPTNQWGTSCKRDGWNFDVYFGGEMVDLVDVVRLLNKLGAKPDDIKRRAAKKVSKRP